MTIQEINVNTVQRRPRASSLVVPPASVWDLNPTESATHRTKSVRTLPGRYRTEGRLEGVNHREDDGTRTQLENRHDSIRSILLASFMGFSLIFGAAMGGVFEDAQVGDQAPVDYTAEVQTLDRR